METKANGEALLREHYRKHSQHLVATFAAKVADYSLRAHNDCADPVHVLPWLGEKQHSYAGNSAVLSLYLRDKAIDLMAIDFCGCYLLAHWARSLCAMPTEHALFPKLRE